MAPHKGLKVVTYHRSWPNFADRFGLDVVGYIEPRPGIPPSAAHTRDLIDDMRRQNVQVILVEPYIDQRPPAQSLARLAHRCMVMPPSVGGVKETTDYFTLFGYNRICSSLRQRDQPRNPDR